MDRLFLIVLNMSLTGAFVIAAICLARLPLKRVPKIISYCLWIVAGFRLVIPFSIESVFGLIPFRAQTISTDVAAKVVPQVSGRIIAADNYINSVPPIASDVYTSGAANIGVSWANVGAYIWVLGAAVMLTYGVVSYMMLKRRMCGSTLAVDNIYESENIKSPFVLGVIRPKIFLPVGLSADEYEYIILHEQTHISRRDHVVKFAAYFILALHWFNPLAWIAFLLMGADMEMSCDERVLKELGVDVKSDYSRSLVSFASKRQIIGTSPLAFGEGGMKGRVKNVLNFKKRSRIAVTAAVILVAALSIGLIMNRAGAPDNELYENHDSDAVLTEKNQRLLNYLDEVYENHRNDIRSVSGVQFPQHEQPLWAPGSVDDIYMILQSRPPGRGWVVSHVTRGGYSRITNIRHPNILEIFYFGSTLWSDEENAALLETAQLLFDYFSELREVNFHVFANEFDVINNRRLHTNGRFTATRDAINGAGQWCLEELYLREIGDVLHLYWGRPIFQWMPEGYDFDAVYAVIDALPLPDSYWQVELVEIGDRFVEYGPHVYSMTIRYIVPYDSSVWWLTFAAEEILMENAAQLFERFDDLLRIGFSMWVHNESEMTSRFYVMGVDRENIG